MNSLPLKYRPGSPGQHDFMLSQFRQIKTGDSFAQYHKVNVLIVENSHIYKVRDDPTQQSY